MADQSRTSAKKHILAAQSRVRDALLRMRPRDFEKLCGNLVQERLGVSVHIARSGSQVGGDASTMGPRDIKIEARRYGDTSGFNERAIIGQMMQSATDQPDLELWMLATTRPVPDQLQTALTKAAESLGLAFVALDWDGGTISKLAAISAVYPDITRAACSELTQTDLKVISEHEHATEAMQRLDRQLAEWAIGFEVLRAQSQNYVETLWSSSTRGEADFNQDVAGGATSAKFLRREGPFASLENWYQGGNTKPIAALLGRDGAGKTWTAFDWMHERRVRLPILLPIQSSAVSKPPRTVLGVKQMLGRELHNLTELRTEAYWTRRVTRLLSRPSSEGAVFTVLLDGINETGGTGWIQFLKLLWAEPFHPQVEVITTIRQDFYANRLNSLGSIKHRPVEVTPYGLEEGGEFDQKLALEGLTRADVNVRAVELACVPRFFDLAIQLKDQLDGISQVTDATLIYAYGQTKLFGASGDAMSASEFEAYVLSLAKTYLSDAPPQTREDLAKLLSSPELGPVDTLKRVSAMMNGLSARAKRPGGLEMSDEFVRFSLAFALIDRLSRVENAAAAEILLTDWFDTLAGFDQRPEILSTAFSLAASDPVGLPDDVMGALIAVWVQSQNLEDDTADILSAFADRAAVPLVVALDHVIDGRNDDAANLVYQALGGLDRTNKEQTRQIAAQVAIWVRRIWVRPVRAGEDPARNSFSVRQRERILERGGLDGDGHFTILENTFHVAEGYQGNGVSIALSLLQGRELSLCGPVFFAAAIHDAIVFVDHIGDPVRWITALNTVDPVETQKCLLELSETVATSELPEALQNKIRRALEVLTNNPDVERTATDRRPRLDVPTEYEDVYLANPSKSAFTLERRHAVAFLEDASISLRHRIQRAKIYLLDPSFDVPADFAAEVIAACRKIDVDILATGRSFTVEDHAFDELSWALARISPKELAGLIRRKFRSLVGKDLSAVESTSRRLQGSVCLVGEAERDAARAARVAVGDPLDETSQMKNQVHNHLLSIETSGLSADRQFRLALERADTPLYLDIVEQFETPSLDEISAIVGEHTPGSQSFNILACLLSHTAEALPPSAFAPLFDHATTFENSDGRQSVCAWLLLQSHFAPQLAKRLVADDWSWSEEMDFQCRLYASRALIAASADIGHEEVIHRAYPFELIQFAGRDDVSSDLAEIIGNIITRVVIRERGDLPNYPAEVFRDLECARRFYDITIGEDRNVDGTPLSFHEQWNTSDEDRRERRQSALNVITSRIAEIRASGEGSYLRDITTKELKSLLSKAPQLSDDWMFGLEDLENIDAQARLRVNFADGFYRALCKVLLELDPPRGVTLWKVLQEHLSMRVIDVGQVNDLIHALFRAPASDAVDAALDTLWDMKWSCTDDRLADLIICARLHGREDWLSDKIDADLTSPNAARRLRATWMKQHSERVSIDALAPQPTGWAQTRLEHIERQGSRLARRESCALHWYRQVIDATTIEAAYAAFLLFEKLVDRRSSSWLAWGPDLRARRDIDQNHDLFRKKCLLVWTGRSSQKGAAKEASKNWDTTLGGVKTVEWLWPWNTQ